MGDSFHASQFVEELDRLADKNFVEIGGILRVLMENERPPHFDDDMRSLLAKLRALGQKEVVDYVCNRYVGPPYHLSLERLGGVCAEK